MWSFPLFCCSLISIILIYSHYCVNCQSVDNTESEIDKSLLNFRFPNEQQTLLVSVRSGRADGSSGRDENAKIRSDIQKIIFNNDPGPAAPPPLFPMQQPANTGTSPNNKNAFIFEPLSQQQSAVLISRPETKSFVSFPKHSKNDFHLKVQHGGEKPCTDGSGLPGICQDFVKCSLYYSEIFRSRNLDGAAARCQLANGKMDGVCCPAISRNKQIDVEELLIPKPSDVNLELRFGVDIRNQLENAVLTTQTRIGEQRRKEQNILNNHVSVKRGTSSYGHLLFFQTSKKAIEISKFGYSLLESSKDISTRLSFGSKESGEGLKKYTLKRSSLRNKCPKESICDPQLKNYRTIDGSCNNLKITNLGMSFTPLLRIIPPDYADGMWSPRIAADKSPLASARLLSSSFVIDQDAPDLRFSLYVMQFGQFLDHDLSHVPIYRFTNGSGIECCSQDGRNFLPPELSHPFCFPIEIPATDRFYRNHAQSCMNFVRSMIGPRIDCSLGHADQLNQITHWLDSSNVYGSTIEEQEELRLFKDGRLKAGRFTGHSGQFRKEILPLQEKEGDECTDPEKGQHCFNAGDLRVNEMMGLTATHIIWFREHNRIAMELKGLNPNWNDDQLYYEARRILNAEYQYIVYNEWLPIVVGRKFMEVYGILPLANGYSSDYDERIDPTVSNAFAAAAFRMGHTLIQGILHLVNELNIIDEELVIHEHFNRPFRIREEGILDKVLRALTTEPIQSFDPFITSEVTQRLFQPQNKPFGMDLIALNIQRARDHGVPGYNHFRDVCKLGRVEIFAGFTDLIPQVALRVLTSYYKHVDDVDLFIGGILERPLEGALLGPTFTCLIGDQFARSKKADRFAYDLGGFEHSFSPAQLHQIRKTSFSRILCDNGDRISRLQPLAFYMPDSGFNPIVDCNGGIIPRMNLAYWKY